MDDERWVPIQGHEGQYEISDHGRVRSLDRMVKKNGYSYFRKGMIMKQGSNLQGYFQVSLCKNGKQKPRQIHRLVAEHFVEGYFEGAHVRHMDGCNTNNHHSNLKWGTVADNHFDMRIRHGRCVGVDSVFSVYTEEETQRAVDLKGTMTGAEAARLTGMTSAHICNLWRGKYGFQRAKAYAEGIRDVE